MMRSLLWKEWHEQGWRIAFGCVMVGAFTAIGLKVRILPDEAILVFTMMFGAVLMPLLMAMGLIAPERADGTLATLLSMPVAPWRPLLVKLFFGALGCLLPLVTATVMIAMIARGREFELWQTFMLYTGTFVFACVFLLWIAAFSVMQPTEARVGLIAIAIVLVYWLLFMLSVQTRTVTVDSGVVATALSSLLWIVNPLALLKMAMNLASPQGSSSRTAFSEQALIVHTAALAVLFWWMLRRYTRLGRVRS